MSPVSVGYASVADAELITTMSRQTFYETFASDNSAANIEKFMNEQFTREVLIKEVGSTLIQTGIGWRKKMNRCCFILWLLSPIVFTSCDPPADLAKDEKEILSLLQQERKAHFDRNTDLFVSEFADSMISVNKGIVTTAGKEENKKRIGKYFGRVEFIKWDDVAKPQIRFSNDGSLAYAVVQKQVILSYPDSLGKKYIDTNDYAWVSIYRKQNGVWKVETNVSTNR